MENSDDVRLVRMEGKVDNICNTVDEIKEGLKEFKGEVQNKFITKERFAPIEKFVYGIVTVISLAVIGAILSLVLRGS